MNEEVENLMKVLAEVSKGLGSEDLSQVVHAAVDGRVDALLIEAERQVAGRIDGSTGLIYPANLDNAHVNDLLDELSELVEKMGGDVHVLSAQRMPSSTGVAASFRH
jgi:stalled ribosome rescue protein Dom34